VESLSLVVVLALVGVVLVARWPVGTSLGIYALLLPFDAVLMLGQVGNIHLHLTWFIGAVAAGILFIRGMLRQKFMSPARPILWLSLMAGWAAFSATWAISSDRVFFQLPLVALLLLLYIVGVSVRMSRKELDLIAWLTILGGCLGAAITVYRFATGQWWIPANALGIERHFTGRASLWETNPDTVAASLMLPLSLTVGQLLSSHRRARRLMLTGAAVLIGAGIFSTMSRGALLACAVVALVYLWRSPARRHILLVLAGMAALLVAMPSNFFGRLGASLADRGAGRLDIWTVGLHAFAQYFFAGAGLNCFPLAYLQNVQAGSNFVGFTRAPHNIILGTAVELGIVGLVLMVLVATEHLRLSAKARNSTKDEAARLHLIPYEAACWGLLTCGMFLDLLWETYFWLALMLLVATVRCWDSAPEADRVPAFERPLRFATLAGPARLGSGQQ
jgi:hypothetical protein